MPVLRLIHLGLLALLVALGLASAARAERIGAFLYLEDAPKVLSLVGPVNADTYFELDDALSRYPAVTTLVLNTTEGDLSSAMQLAELVRSRDLTTFVPLGAKCHNACALIYFAAATSLVEGELGVSRTDASEQVMRRVQSFLDRNKVPGFVSRIMLITPADSLYVFSDSDIADLGLNKRPETAVAETETTKPEEQEPVEPIEPEEDDRNDTLKIGKNGSSTPPRFPIEPAEQEQQQQIAPPKPWRVAVYPGLDFYGNDIWQGKVNTELQCRSQCLKYDSCVAYTFNDDANFCFAKDRIDTLAPFSAAISGQLLAPSVQEAPIYEFGGIDPQQDVKKSSVYNDGDLSTIPVRNENDCLLACMGNENCMAYSYRTSQRMCSLKASADRPRSARGYSSGLKQFRSYYPSDVVIIPR